MRFGLFFGGSAEIPAGLGESPYSLLIEAARFADRNGFAFVATPERHFARFAGLFPNPALTSAALAVATARVQIRPGGIVSPLHDTVGLVEDWSMVDLLSGGRIGLAFDAGRNVDDFALAPDAYANRHDLMFQQVEQIRALWRTRDVVRRDGTGMRVELSVFPEPVTGEVPVWVTVTADPQSFARAGSLGLNVLAEPPGPRPHDLADRIRGYREGRAEAGLDPHDGVVTVLHHTYVSDDPADVRSAVGALVARPGDARTPDPRTTGAAPVRRPEVEYPLLGSVAACSRHVQRLAAAGVDEIACLVDFVADPDLRRRGFTGLATLCHDCAGADRADAVVGVGPDSYLGWG